LPFNIFAKAEASDFNSAMPLGLAKAAIKITPKGKVGVTLG